MSQASRHTILIRAGWHYDATQDRYSAPGAPQNGTAPLYNLEAVWNAYMRSQAIKADPRQRRPL